MSQQMPDWLARRNRGLHMTIRDIDCQNFDVAAMIETFAAWRVTFFSFFAAGYVTTYPSALKLQRQSPWLNGRDLAGEIITAAHRHGIKAIPMIDLGQLPEAALAAHPEWAARDAQGRPVQAADGPLYRSCPLGGYVRDYCRAIVSELCARYEVDAMKFGGGSYGFGATVCHCPACQAAYARDVGRPLPQQPDWESEAWHTYVRWKGERTAETVRCLVDLAHEIRPGLPVVGNAVCFGDPDWTIRSSLDIEELAAIEDIVQVEVQTRLRYDAEGDRGGWQDLRWPAETASYMTSVSTRPIWTVCSYFLAWPWRRSAVPAAEQKVYLAQMAAHGASPMVNLSGGPPQVHEDRSGFSAIQELYTFMADHADLYEGDTSAATVALVYSQESLVSYGSEWARPRYVDNMRGYELALDQAHIPYDIISCRVLDEERLSRYRTLILPGGVWLSDESAAALARFVGRGGGLIADDRPGAWDIQGTRRSDLALGRLLGITARGEPAPVIGTPNELTQAYMRRAADSSLPGASLWAYLREGGSELQLLPLLGRYLPVETLGEAQVLFRRAAPFRVFPEGWAYTTDPDPGEPMMVTREHEGGGRTVYFALQMGKNVYVTRFPPLADLIAGAVRWTLRGELPLEVDAPPTLHTALRRLDGRLAVHCVNLTGGERFFREIVPLHGCRIVVRVPEDAGRVRVTLVSNGAALPFEREGQHCTVVVPELGDYDVVVFDYD